MRATPYWITLIVYLGVSPLLQALGSSRTVALAGQLLATGIVLILWRKHFKFTPKADPWAVVAGFAIAALWVGLSMIVLPYGKLNTTPYGTTDIILKLLVGILLAPLAEEFFTRHYLHRAVETKKWWKEPLGRFSWTAFLVTTAFFGFAHNAWLAGLVTGALLNGLWYWRKDMNSVIVAHAAANAVLGVFVVLSSNWWFW